MRQRFDKDGNPIQTMDFSDTEGMTVTPAGDSDLVNSYLRDKYFTGDLSDDSLKAARAKADEDRAMAGVGRGIATIAAGLTRTDADTKFYDDQAKDADRGVRDIEARRKSKLDEARFAREEQKFGQDEEKYRRDQELQDANSAPSKVFQNALRTAAPGMFTDDELKSVTAADKDRVLSLAQLKETIAARKAQQAEKAGTKRAEQVEKNTIKLGDSIKGTQELSNAVRNVEDKLGGPLDAYENRGGKLMKGGKEQDLPGVSLPLVGRVSAYSGEARDLQSAVAKVFNVELKDRSGAAVTNPEMQRMKTEFASGKFNTEPEMIQALKDYKRLLFQEMKNREAAFAPDVVENYRGHGGQTSQDFAPKRTVSRVQYSPSRNQTKVTYSDGSEEVLNGKVAAH